MRKALLLIVALVLPFAAGAQNPVQNGTQVVVTPKMADSFVDSIGINTHITYTGSDPYQNFNRVLNALTNLGVRHIRDGYQPTTSWGTTYPGSTSYYMYHRQLHAAGIGTDYVTSCLYGGALLSATDIESFASLVTDMEALEGQNEPDANAGACENSTYTTWQAGVEAQLPVLRTAANAIGGGVKVYGPAMTQADSAGEIGSQTANVDYFNVHYYPGGRQPETPGWGSAHGITTANYASLPWWIAEYTTSYTDGSTNYTGYDPSGTGVITEMGYLASPWNSLAYQVPETVQTTYAVRSFLTAFAEGIARTYYFELIDDGADSYLYGLLHADYSAKPAFNSLQALIALLSDKGATFSPSALTFTFSGSTTNLQYVLLEKRDGSYYIALWNNAQIWNPATPGAETVATQTVTLAVTGGPAVQQIYEFQQNGGVSVSQQGGSATVSFPIAADPLLIRVK